MKIIKLNDMPIAMLATIGAAMKCFIFCFSTNKNGLYALLGIALLDYLFTQPLRSTMTKIVDASDVGKVMGKMIYDYVCSFSAFHS